MALRPIKFNDTAGLSPSPPTRQCQSTKVLTSLYLCNKMYCAGGERSTGLAFLNDTCQSKVNHTIPSFDLVDDYTDERMDQLYHFQKTEWENGATFQNPVLPSEYFFLLAYNTLVS